MDSEWDSMARKMISKYHLESHLPKSFTNEVDIIRRLTNVSTLSETFRSWLKNLPDVRADNDEKSEQYRLRGNDIFKNKMNDHLALEAYSKAIFWAPKKSKALALGHANRAILLIRFGHYREAFDDCQIALSGAYPESNRLKLYFRQAECAEHLNNRSMLESAIEGISNIASKTQLLLAEKVKLLQLEALLKIPENKSSKNPVVKSADDLELPNLREEVSSYAGRYVVTTAMIPQNSIITRETAVSFVPVYAFDTKSTIPPFDCQKCARVNVIPFPCSVCGRACYCSSTCRLEHLKLHIYECYGYQKHLWYHIGIAHLGIRCFLDEFNNMFAKIRKSTDAMTCFEILTKSTKQDKNQQEDYSRVFGLVTNFEKMDKTDIIQYSLVALMLTVYLRDCSMFFEENSFNLTMPPKELFIFCGAVILRHIGQMVCNGHAISELRCTLPSAINCFENGSNRIKTGFLHRIFKSSRVFTAIFPRISLFNHSCYPNILNCFEGSILTVYATQKLNSGDEIYNCYGPNYKTMPASERKEHLRQQYFFICNCVRCLENDDSFSETFKLINCPWGACRKTFSMDLNEEDLWKGLQCMHCGGEINCSWYETIRNIIGTDNAYSKHLFQQCVRAYENGSKILGSYNQLRLNVLHLIFDQFLETASIDGDCSHFLKKMAIEFVMIRRNQFGYMSLEYLVGCFYLIDILAIEIKTKVKTMNMNSEQQTILKEFREALKLVGENTRSMILSYMDDVIKST